MTDTVITIEPVEATGRVLNNQRPRHIVELDPHGQPTDKCLCGYLWDRAFVPHNGEICQECVGELRRRGLG